MTKDRTRCLDFSKIDARELRRSIGNDRTQTDLVSPEAWLDNARLLEPDIRSFVERGGKLVYVRLPVGYEPYRIDQEQYPRREYWDKLAEFTLAEMIHFEDVPGMDQIEAPDGSHIDMRDQERLTTLLLDELVRRGILTE